MKRELIVLFCLVVAASPTVAQSKKSDKCERETGWSHEDCWRIVQHHVWEGMTKDQAIAALGKPKAEVRVADDLRLTFKHVRVNSPSSSPLIVGSETVVVHVATKGCEQKPSECKVSKIEQP
jgi:hypothetical protein